MADEEKIGQMGDIIGTTRDRLQSAPGGGDRLRDLIPARGLPLSPEKRDRRSCPTPGSCRATTFLKSPKTPS